MDYKTTSQRTGALPSFQNGQATNPHKTGAFPYVKDHEVSGSDQLVGGENAPKDLKGVAKAVAPLSSCPAAITLPSGFHYNEADSNLDPRKPFTTTPSPPLGVLANFSQNYAGFGFNTIFRPDNAATPTPFPRSVTPPVPQIPNDNVLELNLTFESLAFSAPVGCVPNRGSQQQGDIFLNGVPYVQTVWDITDIKTGYNDGPAIPIHLEPGLFMHVPATTTDPTLGESIVRMASIPHGTTINAQGLAPSSSIAGPPSIPTVDITPFAIGTSQKPGATVVFPSQTADNLDTPRIPQDLTLFIASGMINQDILTDPNTVLRNALEGLTIINTIAFTVSTNPEAPELGGGTANIAFLQGNPGTQSPGGPQVGPNAFVPQVTATFWIETVQWEVEVPAFKPGQVSEVLTQ
jgi:hypothetical protein